MYGERDLVQYECAEGSVANEVRRQVIRAHAIHACKEEEENGGEKKWELKDEGRGGEKERRGGGEERIGKERGVGEKRRKGSRRRGDYHRKGGGRRRRGGEVCRRYG